MMGLVFLCFCGKVCGFCGFVCNYNSILFSILSRGWFLPGVKREEIEGGSMNGYGGMGNGRQRGMGRMWEAGTGCDWDGWDWNGVDCFGGGHKAWVKARGLGVPGANFASQNGSPSTTDELTF